MSVFANMSRSILFGQKANTTDPTFGNVVKASLSRAVGVEVKNAPTVSQYAWHVGVRAVQSAIGIRLQKTGNERLPQGWPPGIFAIIAKEIESKGGTVKLEDGAIIPAFRLTTANAAVLPHMWVAYIKPTTSYSDYKKALALDESIEESLSQKGLSLTARVMGKPLRVEVERPDAEAISLADDWHILKAQPQNAYEYTFGTYFKDRSLQIGYAEFPDPNEAHAAIVGMSGSGKSQLALSILLSAALNTSPELLSMIIIDPKCVDFAPLASLPHLASGEVIYDHKSAAAAVREVVAEMDRRTKPGVDGSTFKKSILLFIDELPDLLDQDRKSDDKESLEDALVRLLQKGRGVGISVFVAAQQSKKEVMSTRILENMSWRMVGSVNTFHASVHASGQDGCLAHKLPGKGSFLMYNPEFRSGVRVQSYFVANPRVDGYAATIQRQFIDDIAARWGYIKPHWTFGKRAASGMQDELPFAPVATISDEHGTELDGNEKAKPSEFPGAFYVAAVKAYAQSPQKFSIRAIRSLHIALYGNECRHERAKRLYEMIVDDDNGTRYAEPLA